MRLKEKLCELVLKHSGVLFHHLRLIVNSLIFLNSKKTIISRWENGQRIVIDEDVSNYLQGLKLFYVVEGFQSDILFSSKMLEKFYDGSTSTYDELMTLICPTFSLSFIIVIGSSSF